MVTSRQWEGGHPGDESEMESCQAAFAFLASCPKIPCIRMMMIIIIIRGRHWCRKSHCSRIDPPNLRRDPSWLSSVQSSDQHVCLTMFLPQSLQIIENYVLARRVGLPVGCCSLHFMCSIPFHRRIMCVLGLYIEALGHHNIDTDDGNSHEGTKLLAQTLFSLLTNTILNKKKLSFKTLCPYC